MRKEAVLALAKGFRGRAKNCIRVRAPLRPLPDPAPHPRPPPRPTPALCGGACAGGAVRRVLSSPGRLGGGLAKRGGG